MLFEIRVIDGQWCLDSYGHSGDAQQALMDRDRLHPLGAWYHVAAVYDGREFSNYVNGDQAERRRDPLRPSARPAARRSACASTWSTTSRARFTCARFTRRALAPAEFLQVASVVDELASWSR